MKKRSTITHTENRCFWKLYQEWSKKISIASANLRYLLQFIKLVFLKQLHSFQKRNTFDLHIASVSLQLSVLAVLICSERFFSALLVLFLGYLWPVAHWMYSTVVLKSLLLFVILRISFSLIRSSRVKLWSLVTLHSCWLSIELR